ncbi:MAG TPA: endonuclease/exonuclease/phosphatase family protein [Steroidobacteraceae bacterium]|nr:endonuclease/exonuclease/phosphatase family protein [Steroidobacteraceae bacterium]
MRGVIAALLVGLTSAAAVGTQPADAAGSFPGSFRVATFNCSLNRGSQGELLRELSTADSAQARAVAEIIQRVRPDILLLQEFDWDAAGASVDAFRSNYLARAQNGAQPIRYRYSFFTESNTGQPSGFDLSNDGRIEGGQDALGFGEFPGQYAMVLLSRFPIDAKHARTFRKLLWKDMPGAMLPDDSTTDGSADWYSPQELAVLPLSSKSHWDVPVKIGGFTLHVLASHPTPPAFDGPEDRNGMRNHDEVRFWGDYLSGAAASHTYIRDDRGHRGGFAGKAFIVMGDQNTDPFDGGSRHDAIEALIHSSRINSSFTPASEGAPEAGDAQGDANATHQGDARFDTADFNDRVAGNLRVDYLLPSKGLRVCGGGVFWPRQEEPQAALVWGDRPPPSSDHRLVWLDLTSDPARCRPGSDPKASASSRPDRRTRRGRTTSSTSTSRGPGRAGCCR